MPVYAILGGFAITGILGWFIMEYAFRQKMHPDDPVNNMPVFKILSISMPMLVVGV